MWWGRPSPPQPTRPQGTIRWLSGPTQSLKHGPSQAGDRSQEACLHTQATRPLISKSPDQQPQAHACSGAFRSFRKDHGFLGDAHSVEAPVAPEVGPVQADSGVDLKARVQPGCRSTPQASNESQRSLDLASPQPLGSIMRDQRTLDERLVQKMGGPLPSAGHVHVVASAKLVAHVAAPHEAARTKTRDETFPGSHHMGCFSSIHAWRMVDAVGQWLSDLSDLLSEAQIRHLTLAGTGS